MDQVTAFVKKNKFAVGSFVVLAIAVIGYAAYVSTTDMDGYVDLVSADDDLVDVAEVVDIITPDE